MYEAKLLWQEVKITHYIVKLHVRVLCESAVVDGGVDNGSGVVKDVFHRSAFHFLYEPQFLCHGFLCFDLI
jgi:hypothetical protein